jgi:ATP-dependent RNA helicase DeaD
VTDSEEEKLPFAELPLDPRLLAAVEQLGFEYATPIQARAIPLLLGGTDAIGRARTGSGKTAAFGLPMLERLKDGGKHVRALILAPTRELALQVTDAIKAFSKQLPVKTVCIYGGAPYEPQMRALRQGTPIVVGTPGRVLDHLMRGTLDLSRVEVMVLDEADEMLNMGFLEDVTQILDATPDTRQVCLFSATLPQQIRRIADKYLSDPVEIQVESSSLSVDHIEQKWIRVPERFKLDALERVLGAEPRGTALVFARTRKDCAAMADALAARGIPVDALHGDLNQAARERVLARLRARRLDVVIATDVASRGIDVQHITHVINLDIPRNTENYVHRIGLTSRAGRSGVAISFATPKQKRRIRELQSQLKVRIEQVDVPSDAAIAHRRRVALGDDLRAAVKTDLTDARALLEMLDGVEAEDLAAAALKVLAAARGVPLGEVDDAPPAWSKQRSEDNRGGGDVGDLNEVELFFPVGKRHGVRPADLVGALANEIGIPGNQIGRITIFDRKSFVGLPIRHAKAATDYGDRIAIRGEEVRMSKAHPRPAVERPTFRGRRNRPYRPGGKGPQRR